MPDMRAPSVLAPSALAAACLVLALGGCGSDDPEIPTATSTTGARKASFPLTVSRAGGIAGFRDQLSIQEDGAVLATVKAGRVTCTLDRASLAILNDAAVHITDTDQPTRPPSPPADAMVVLLSAGTGVLSIEDARVAKAEPVVTQLLADVTGPASARKVCT